jgi:hypothetical protein
VCGQMAFVHNIDMVSLPMQDGPVLCTSEKGIAREFLWLKSAPAERLEKVRGTMLIYFSSFRNKYHSLIFTRSLGHAKGRFRMCACCIMADCTMSCFRVAVCGMDSNLTLLS